MKPFIDPSFWSDPEIEILKSGGKLCMLWLVTNSQTSLLGICGASESRFTFETGLPKEALARALEGLPRAIVRVGNVIFVRNYIRHQFGSGEKLIRNNFFVALKSLFLGIKDEKLRSVVLTEYPEFQEVSEGLTKPKVRRVRKGKRITESESEADQIYQAYPLKKGKPDALRAIVGAMNRGNDFDLLLSKTKAYSAARGGDLSFVPNPSTWFNQDRFKDDPETWVRTNGEKPNKPTEKIKWIN